MKNLGIKYQLRLMSMIPVLVVSLIFALFYYHQYNNDLKQHMLRFGQASLQPFIASSLHAVETQDGQTLKAMLTTAHINNEIQALAIYHVDGKLLAYRGEKLGLFQPYLPKNFQVTQIKSQKITPYSLNFIIPIFQDQRIVGWISVIMDSKFMLIKRYQMVIAGILITLIGLLLSLGVHYFLSKNIHQPIARLRRTFRHILNNVFDTPIVVSSAGELGLIERGCARLQQEYLNTVKDLNQHIEDATMDLQQSLEMLEEKNIELLLEKKKSEEKNRQKSEFIANMSHEIRTPMNGVIGFANVLLESKLDALQLDYVKTIKSSAQDLLATINDILDYSKMDAGKLHLECIPLNIRACIDEVLVLLAPTAHNKGLDIIPITEINVPKTVMGDPWRLKQIMSHLVSNAIKFTEQGYILIRTQVEQENDSHYTICISVIDTGIGISSDEQTILFSVFNPQNPTTQHDGSSGLGLAICKKLVEHMQGRITVHSEKHKGTTFSVHIKLDKLAPYEIEKHQLTRFNHLNAICYDENPLHLEALCNSLGYLGIQCIRIHTFNQLESSFRQHPECHMAFLNLNQGNEDYILQILRHQTIPCILISKWFIQDYQTLNAQGFLFKPPNIQKLHEVIETLISNKARPVNVPRIETSNQALEQLRLQVHQANLKVLIAEDNRINRMLLTSLLSKYVCIETVDDGMKTVEICNQQPFSVILLDFQMPKLNGLEAARQIRLASLANQKTPIILITANGGDIHQELIKKAGIELCLEKPIDEKNLLHHLLHLANQPQPQAIHWPTCVKKSSANPALAYEFLTQFVEELQQNRQEFIEYYQAHDWLALEHLAHKVHGACCFCGVPELQKCVVNVEKLAKHVAANNAPIPENFQQVFSLLLIHIDAVINEYQRSYQNNMEFLCQ